ncbi:helix-turn-helix domain-containing protein [Limosilactobacillus antri]|uniref:helix-turn-helix domain-containing protein n=1 Tax=Limosilactobacillus antri TaxID=227943 RepID=UPI001F57A0C5|nr:helix-turn-helix domain-containing protein [Limosilactobacillus antri]
MQDEALLSEIKSYVAKAVKQLSCQPAFMNKKQAAAYLNISVNTLNLWIRRFPNFPYVEIGGCYRFKADQIDEFMKDNQ